MKEIKRVFIRRMMDILSDEVYFAMLPKDRLEILKTLMPKIRKHDYQCEEF